MEGGEVPLVTIKVQMIASEEESPVEQQATVASGMPRRWDGNESRCQFVSLISIEYDLGIGL